MILDTISPYITHVLNAFLMLLGFFLSMKYMPETLGQPMTETFEEFNNIYCPTGSDSKPVTVPVESTGENENLLEKSKNGSAQIFKTENLPESDI